MTQKLKDILNNVLRLKSVVNWRHKAYELASSILECSMVPKSLSFTY